MHYQHFDFDARLFRVNDKNLEKPVNWPLFMLSTVLYVYIVRHNDVFVVLKGGKTTMCLHFHCPFGS